MSRGVVLGVLAGVLTLVLAGPAAASTCGSFTTINSLLSTTSPDGHFKLYSDSLSGPPSDYGTALDKAYEKLTADGWWAPPGAPYTVVVADPANTTHTVTAQPQGSAGDNPASPWVETDAQNVCFGMTSDLSGSPLLTPLTAREMQRAVLYGIGALTPTPPPAVFSNGTPILAEEEMPDPASNVDEGTLWPDFGKGLADLGTGGWVVLEGIAAQHGGYHLLQALWQHIGEGQTDAVAALEQALTDSGSTLAQAVQEAAITLIELKKCPSGAPFCFNKADEYAAQSTGRPAVQASVPSVPADPVQGTVADGYGMAWIGLPAAREDLTVQNTAAAGSLLVSAICTRGDGSLYRVAFPSAIGAGQSGVVRAFPSVPCADAPVLVVTSGANSSGQAAQRSFLVTASAPTAALTVSLSGDGAGKVTSKPAGIDCGSACAINAPADSSVDLIAAPASGSVFAGWDGACKSFGAQLTCTVKMSNPQAAVAKFAKVPAPPVASPTPVATPPSQSVTPTVPPSIAKDRTAPQVRVTRARVSARALKLTVLCPAIEVNHCSGFVSVVVKARRKSLKFADQAFIELRGGRTAILNFRLTSRSRKLLRGVRTVKVKAIVRGRDDAFNYATTTRTITVRLR